MLYNFTREELTRIENALDKVPAHLDRETIRTNSFNNAGDVPQAEVVDVIVSTIAMYIDQGCESF